MTPRFFLGRAVQAALTLLFLSFFVYFLIGLMPGDPVDIMAAGNPRMTAEDATRLRAAYGLDQPLAARYGRWLSAAAMGDFGYSRLYGLPVQDIIIPRLGQSAILLGASLLLTLLLAVPLGVFAAAREGKAADRVIGFVTLAGISLPAFWTGLLLIALFAATLGWLPAGAALPAAPLKDKLLSAVLPVATLTLASLAVYTRHMRASMLAQLPEEYIKTARAKGCAPMRVLWLHACRNATVPVVTILMLDMGVLFGGALTVETVFAWPGMGKLLFDAVMANDYNLALCGFLVLTFFVLLGSLLADVLYALLDPRVADGVKK